MKRPMLIVTTLYLGGIILANLVQSHGERVTLWPLLLGTSAAALAALFWGRIRSGLLALALVLAGAANLSLVTELLSPIDVCRVISGEPQLVAIRGRLLETPLHRIYSHQDEVTHRTQAEVRIEAVRI